MIRYLIALPWFVLGAVASFLLVHADLHIKRINALDVDRRWPLRGPTDR